MSKVSQNVLLFLDPWFFRKYFKWFLGVFKIFFAYKNEHSSTRQESNGRIDIITSKLPPYRGSPGGVSFFGIKLSIQHMMLTRKMGSWESQKKTHFREYTSPKRELPVVRSQFYCQLSDRSFRLLIKKPCPYKGVTRALKI